MSGLAKQSWEHPPLFSVHPVFTPEEVVLVKHKEMFLDVLQVQLKNNVSDSVWKIGGIAQLNTRWLTRGVYNFNAVLQFVLCRKEHSGRPVRVIPCHYTLLIPGVL